MGNKQQTPRALLELAEESLTTMTDFYYKECIVATADQSAALAMFFQSPTDDTGETKGGSSDETIPPHIVASQARTMLTNTLTSIISALLGRPISQASNKDRRATNEEKEAIAIILSTGVEEDGKKKKKIGAGKIGSGLIDKMVTNMMLFDLEAKKSLVIIMQTLVRESLPFRSYVTGSGSDDPNGLSPIVHKLVQGFEVKSFSSKHGIALFTGPMLMTIVRNDDRTASVVLENHLDRFLDEFVQSTSYDIKTIAFDTLRDLLFTVDDRKETILRTNAANYINKLWVPSLEDSKANSNGKPSSNQFFTKINVLLQKRDFTTVKATVKLLQSVLFCPSKVTFDTMLAYVGDPRNLIVAMNLLRDQAAQLQFEGYHLFKVFVLNPNRPETITTVLARNKNGIVKYLDTFQLDRQSDDPQFEGELKQVQNALRNMDETGMIKKDMLKQASEEAPAEAAPAEAAPAEAAPAEAAPAETAPAEAAPAEAAPAEAAPTAEEAAVPEEAAKAEASPVEAKKQ